jgi:hypothetical protein
MKIVVLSLICLGAILSSLPGKVLLDPLYSPDGAIALSVAQGERQAATYSISRKGEQIILPSRLGLRTRYGDLLQGEITRDPVIRTHQSSWRPLFGLQSEIKREYNEAVLSLSFDNGLFFHVVFRVFNDGVAFRYGIPKQRGLETLLILEDLSEFNFPGDPTCWTIQQDPERERFHPGLMSESSYSKAPMFIQAEGAWVALNEAAIYGMSYMQWVNPTGRSGMRADIDPSEVSLPAATPWRVIQIGSRAGDIVESTIIANLNRPANPHVFDWVKPGKSLWDHRNHGDVINGFTYGKDEASFRRYIDFAAENDIEYVLIDAGWYTDQGPLFPREELNINGLIPYARERGVGINLYIDRGSGHHNTWDLEEVLQAFREWGVAGIKYGFLSRELGFGRHTIDRARFVRETREIVEMCARHELLVNFHDRVVPPGGEHYTWPNLIVQEYGKAQQDGHPVPGGRQVEPRLAVSIPFTLGLNGPHDMTNGFFDLEDLASRRTVDPLGINTTVVAETARCLINYSPMLILGDNGDAFAAKDDLFDFIRTMPDTWDESRVLAGEPGQYIVVARRAGQDWFIAGNTNEMGRDFELDLGFVFPRTYQVTLYRDAEDTHFQSNKEAYVVEELPRLPNAPLPIRMAPGGGFCLRLLAPEEG